MSPKERILAALYEAIDETNLQLPANERLMKDPTQQIFGSGGKLDSLGLVNFMVAAEQKVESKLGTNVSIASELLSSEDTKPFETIDSLAEFIAARMD